VTQVKGIEVGTPSRAIHIHDRHCDGGGHHAVGLAMLIGLNSGVIFLVLQDKMGPIFEDLDDAAREPFKMNVSTDEIA